MRHVDWPGEPTLFEKITADAARYPPPGGVWIVSPPVAGTCCGIDLVYYRGVNDRVVIDTVLRADGTELDVTFVYRGDDQPRPEFDSLGAVVGYLMMEGVLCSH